MPTSVCRIMLDTCGYSGAPPLRDPVARARWLLLNGGWYDRGFPGAVAESLTQLLEGAPAVMYGYVSPRSRTVGGAFSAAMSRLKPLKTPLIRNHQLARGLYSGNILDSESVFATPDVVVDRAYLAGDEARWRLLESEFLRPLGLGDIGRVMISEGDRMLAMCGAFTSSPGRRFSAQELERISLILPELKRLILGWHEIIDPNSNPQLLLKTGGHWRSPMLLVGGAGHILYANAAARAVFPEGPPRPKVEAVGEPWDLGCGWHHLKLPSASQGAIWVYTSLSAQPENGWLFTYANTLELSRHLTEVARWVVVGKTDREIAAIVDRSVSTVQSYTKKLLKTLDVPTRTSLADRATEQALARPAELWPVTVRQN